MKKTTLIFSAALLFGIGGAFASNQHADEPFVLNRSGDAYIPKSEGLADGGICDDAQTTTCSFLDDQGTMPNPADPGAWHY